MKDLSEIKEALISIENGTIRIVIGKINKHHENYHDRVSACISFIESNERSTPEIYLKGHQIEKMNVYDEIPETHPRFKEYCEQLEGFKETIEVKKKFSWKKFKFETYRSVWSHHWGSRYYFKPEFWDPQEYRANNWTINEIN